MRFAKNHSEASMGSPCFISLHTFCVSLITSSGYIIKINTIWHVSNIPITNLTLRYTNLEFFCNYNFFSTILLEIIQKRTGVNKAQDEIST